MVSAQPEAEKIEGYEGMDLIVIFGVLMMAIGVASYKMVERMYQAWQGQRGDRDDPEDDGSGEPRVASMMVKGRGEGRGVMDTSLKRRRGDDSIRRPLTSRSASSQGHGFKNHFWMRMRWRMRMMLRDQMQLHYHIKLRYHVKLHYQKKMRMSQRLIQQHCSTIDAIEQELRENANHELLPGSSEDCQQRALRSGEPQHQDRPLGESQGRALQPEEGPRRDRAQGGQPGPQRGESHEDRSRGGKMRNQAGARGSDDGQPARLTVLNDVSIGGGGRKVNPADPENFLFYNQMPEGPIITPNGTRYHRKTTCPTLANSRKIRSDLCSQHEPLRCCGLQRPIRGSPCAPELPKHSGVNVLLSRVSRC